MCARMRVLSAKTRVRLLEALEECGERGATVEELHRVELGTRQNVSNHLQLMIAARLVRCAGEGRRVRYWLEDYTWRRPVDTAVESVRASVEEMQAVLDAADAEPSA